MKISAVAVVLTCLLAPQRSPGSEPAAKPAVPKSAAPAARPAGHPALADRVVLLHERLEVTHVLATRRPEDLRSKEILAGDGLAVTDVEAFFKTSKVRLAAIPAGTTGVVLDVVEPWAKGNEVRAVKVGLLSGPLDGQSWWISVPGVAVRKTPEGDRRIERWQALVASGERKEPRYVRTYVSPAPDAAPSRPDARRDRR